MGVKYISPLFIQAPRPLLHLIPIRHHGPPQVSSVMRVVLRSLHEYVGDDRPSQVPSSTRCPSTFARMSGL